MKDTDKLGRTAWITFLIAASPIALFCIGMTFLWIQSLLVEDIGPIEEPPLPTLQKIILLSSMISLPMTWTFGITVAHRFNGAMLQTIPFFANMLPTTGLLWFSFILTCDDGGEFVWMIAYTGVLTALLALGLSAALVSTRQKTQTPNKSCDATGDNAPC